MYNNEICLLTKDLKIVTTLHGCVTDLQTNGRSILLPEYQYIAFGFNYDDLERVKKRIIKEQNSVKNKPKKITNNLLRENLLKTFDVWVKPLNNIGVQTYIAPHDSPAEEKPEVSFKLYYKKIKDCRIVAGCKEGCYGILTNDVIFDHIPIECFNEPKKCMVQGDTYEILFFDPNK